MPTGSHIVLPIERESGNDRVSGPHLFKVQMSTGTYIL